MGMEMRIGSVNLVFGPKTRVVRFQGCMKEVPGAVKSNITAGEFFKGVIGHFPGTLSPEMAEEILADRVVIGVSVPKIPLPKMINVPGMGIRVMKGVLTGGQMATLCKKTGYEIMEYDADRLEAAIADPSNIDRGIGWLTWHDGEKYAEELMRQYPDREFRAIKDKREWHAIKEKVQNELCDRRFWIWTEEKDSPYCDTLILRHLVNDRRRVDYPMRRYHDFAVRLIEEKIKS